MNPSATPSAQVHLVVIGCPGTLRIQELTCAAQRHPSFRLQVWSWREVLEDRVDWTLLREHQPCWLRLESPGKDWPVEQTLLKLGAAVTADSGHGFAALAADQVAALPSRPGIILAQHQWWLGWQAALRTLRERLATEAPHVRFTTPPEDVWTLFDKHACQDRLEFHGVACPAATDIITGGFSQLRDLMTAPRSGWARLFLKPCHGSSASGVVALEWSPRHGYQAQTTVELVRDADGLQLFNSRRLHRSTDPDQIAVLCEEVTRHRAYAQQWVPKAGWEGSRLDFRVVVIAGRARHVVPRLSAHPMTNLQLGGQRGDVARLRQHMGEKAWAELLSTAESAAAVFLEALHVSLDIAATSGFRRFLVLEANAFGDFLPGLLWEGRTTHDWEYEAMLKLDTQVSTSGA